MIRRKPHEIIRSEDGGKISEQKMTDEELIRQFVRQGFSVRAAKIMVHFVRKRVQ